MVDLGRDKRSLPGRGGWDGRAGVKPVFHVFVEKYVCHAGLAFPFPWWRITNSWGATYRILGGILV